MELTDRVGTESHITCKRAVQAGEFRYLTMRTLACASCWYFNRIIVTTAVALFVTHSAASAEHPVLSILKKSPEVYSATVAVEPATDAVIVHLQDWHWVPYAYFRAEGGDLEEYFAFLQRVEAVQAEQYELLKRLNAAGHETIFREALTPDVEPVFKAMCRKLWKRHRQMPDGHEQLFVSPNVLSVGTPGRLLAEGLVKRVRAADSDASLALTYPFDDAGNLREVPPAAMEKREDYVIRQMLKSEGVSILVYGGGHDFADNVRRLGKDRTGLIVVRTKKYREAAQ